MKTLAQLVRPNILSLAPYSTARDEYKGGDISVWLDANESPYNNGINRYPDPHQKELKAAIARLKGAVPEQLFIGNGSDEAIDLAFRIFCRPGVDNVVSISPTYGMYSVCAAINDVELREVLLEEGYTLPVDKLLAAADDNTKLLWLCSPNNPTGNAFPSPAVERLLRGFEGIVIIDEAYIDFAEEPSWIHRLAEFPNLIVLQTFSKAWGMAGLRLGLAFAAPEVAELFARVKYPYNINTPTQATALAQITRGIEAQVAEIRQQRELLAEALQHCPAVERVFPSQANFLLVQVENPNGQYERLIQTGVIVRNRSHIAGCEGCLRITVGTPEENQKLLRELQS